MAVRCLVITVIGFISGSMMYSYLIPKYLKGVDVRRIPGDGNPGSSNAIRAAGPVIGFACMALDVLKAFVPVFFAVSFGGIRGILLVPVILAPVLGHAFSPFLHFRGGKAVSVLFGVLLAILPISRIVILPAAAFLFFRYVAVVRPDSSSVIAGTVAAILLSFVFEPLLSVKIAFAAVGMVVIYKMQAHPDAGEQSVSIGRYSCTFEQNRLKVHKF